MAYCDTNIITSFINKHRLTKVFGRYGGEKFSSSIRAEKPIGEDKAKKIQKCRVSRIPLLNDIGRHEPSLGAVLTFSGTKDLEVVKVDGLKKGREIYNKTCSTINENSGFYKKFCENKKLKQDKDLIYNDLNDIRHFGSALELGEDTFITMNQKDFKPLKNHTKIKIE